MTRQEMLEAAEVLKAAAEGKKIQWRPSTRDSWIDVTGNVENLVFNFEENWYRVKPEERYEPYRGMTDFVDLGYAERSDKSVVMKNHGDVPGVIVQISVGCVSVRFYDTERGDTTILDFTYEQFLNECSWNDDNTPCGILIDE